MSANGRAFHIVCMHTQSLSVEALGRRSQARRLPPKTTQGPAYVRKIDDTIAEVFDGRGRHHVRYGHIHLHVFKRGTVTAVKHKEGVMEYYVRLFTSVVDPDFILMDDNARHIKLIWLTDFRKVRIFAEWIGQLDLQISSVYSRPGALLGRQLQLAPPRTIQGLKTELLNERD
ncbi:hypothetical protein TNCV_34761 [Trichonephila clavipes]|nr:hypothetical protein TNCV_34761 [Trichonephila clavipes]